MALGVSGRYLRGVQAVTWMMYGVLVGYALLALLVALALHKRK